MAKHRMSPHASFTRVAAKLLHHEPPCMSEAEDWESSSGFLADEHIPKALILSTPERLSQERSLAQQPDALEDPGGEFRGRGFPC